MQLCRPLEVPKSLTSAGRSLLEGWQMVVQGQELQPKGRGHRFACQIPAPNAERSGLGDAASEGICSRSRTEAPTEERGPVPCF